jgi:tRNA-dihydrouridine synthase B
MIGRAAQGRPWIFREIAHFMATGEYLPQPSPATICRVLTGHLENLYSFYGEYTGVRVARKHIAWYSKHQCNGNRFRQAINRTETAAEQLEHVRQYFDALAQQQELAA